MKTIPKSCVNYICRRCKSDKQIPRKFSLENDMILSGVPSHLQGLTQIEEMLIARALPIMRVYVKTKTWGPMRVLWTLYKLTSESV